MISTVKKVLCILISLLFVFIVPAKEVVTMSNEIADITNTSPVTVRKRLQYGRKLLKTEIERKS